MATHIMTYISDMQEELPSLITRFKMNDFASSQIAYDDIGGLVIPIVGKPLRELPGMAKAGKDFCAMGTVGNYWSAALSPWLLTGGIAVEAITCAEPHGHGFSVIRAPGQFHMKVEGENLEFSIKTSEAEPLLVAEKVLKGYPQHIAGSYDLLAKSFSLYVDGVLVKNLVLSEVLATLSGNVSLLSPLTGSTTEAVGQNIAVYGAPLSVKRIRQHFRGFRAILSDPGHIRRFLPISVNT